MALTAEQQAQLDTQLALQDSQLAKQSELEARRTRLEAVRLAKEVLIENARSKPVDARDVSAADIQAFAQTLVAYINS